MSSSARQVWSAAILLIGAVVVAAVFTFGSFNEHGQRPVKDQSDDGAGLSASVGPIADPRTTEDVLQAGIAFLMREQASDGGWHSETYGALRGGAAVTALATYAIAQAPQRFRAEHEARLAKAWAFLRPSIEQHGYICNPDGSADYPTYTTAMSLVAAKRLGWQLSPQTEQHFVDYLVRSQLTEQQGWTPDDAHYGGWDMAGGSAAGGKRITPGTNLSVTSIAVEALAVSSSDRALAARKKSVAWIYRCQNLPGDGGFVFSPLDNDIANKAGMTAMGPRSYATMTCDGLLALLNSGEPAESVRVRAALTWIKAHPQLEKVPGFAGGPAEVDMAWENDLRFYYYASLARATRRFPELNSPDLRKRLTAVLATLQAKDGSWTNPSTTARMREDDPLIATSLGVIALGQLVPD